VARALTAEPVVLLLDEPLSALDPVTARDVRDALVQVRETSGVAMLLVTHDLTDALALADDLLILHDGTVTARQRAQALLAAPPSLTAARALGVFSEIPGAIEPQGDAHQFVWAGGVIDVKRPLPVGPAIACVRAQQVRITAAVPGEPDTLRVVSERPTAHGADLLLAGPRGAPVHVPTHWQRDARLAGSLVRVTLDDPHLFPAPRD
jgi:ABC-type sulfate/molybdate transport systems ATPase subunit